jgi:hypothetical protein
MLRLWQERYPNFRAECIERETPLRDCTNSHGVLLAIPTRLGDASLRQLWNSATITLFVTVLGPSSPRKREMLASAMSGRKRANLGRISSWIGFSKNSIVALRESTELAASVCCSNSSGDR